MLTSLKTGATIPKELAGGLPILGVVMGRLLSEIASGFLRTRCRSQTDSPFCVGCVLIFTFFNAFQWGDHRLRTGGRPAQELAGGLFMPGVVLGRSWAKSQTVF